MSIKISELPQATSVGSSDIVPIVQGGTTKQATAGMMNLDVYSTTEQVVGTWIDGKPLYEITIQTVTPTVTSSGAPQVTETSVSFLSIDKVIRVEAFLTTTINNTIQFPVIDGDIEGYVVIKAFCSPSTLTINSNNPARSNLVTYATIRYTKTTD